MVSLVNIGIIITYILISVGAIIAIGFGFLKVFAKNSNSKKSLIFLSSLVIITLIAFVFASDSVLPSYEKYQISSSVSKRVGVGLYTFYILIFLAGFGIIFSEISKAINRK